MSLAFGTWHVHVHVVQLGSEFLPFWEWKTVLFTVVGEEVFRMKAEKRNERISFWLFSR